MSTALLLNSRPATPVDARSNVSSTFVAGAAVISAVLLIPCLLYTLHLAPYLRVLYPVMNLALAAVLYARRSPWFAGHCVLLFCFVSLVRRLVDDQSGFDPASPILITPYLCCLFTGLALVEYWLRPQPRHLGGFLVIMIAILYGALLAVVQGNVIAAAIDFLKWGAGPMLAVYVLAQQRTHEQVRMVTEDCLIWAGAVMGLYGAYQYVNPPSWDLLWARGVFDLGMDSIGRPEPFGLRVFSTMNSPGSLGGVLSASILLALKRPLPVAVPTITLMLLGIALAQYRTIWAATALGALMLVFTRPGVFRPANLLALLAVILAFSASTFIPQIRETIIQRASTMTNLRADQSGEERLGQYHALTREDGLIVGEGLGQIGVARRLGGMPRVILDSALIEIWRGLGVVAGTAYLGALIMLVATLFTRAPDVAHHLHFDRAIVIAAFIQLPMGSVHSGENGIFAWLFLGYGVGGTGTKEVSAMKDILFITHVGVPGGAEFKMMDLAESIEHDSEVMLMQHGSLETMLQQRGIRVSVNALPPAASKVRREGGLIGMLRAIPATLSMIRRVARKARDFEVVVSFSQKSFVVAALAKPFMRRPIVWFMNDILSRDHFNPMLMRFLVVLSRIAADQVVLNSEASLRAWLDAGGRRTRVSIIHPMTRGDLVAAQTRDVLRVAFHRQTFSRDNRPLVGMFGRISPWKGQDVFLRAIAQIPNVNAVIAGGALFGEEAYELRMKALAQELGIADRVTFAGHVDEVVAIMAACDVVAHCSTSPEPFGRVIVESMFVGTPVIASDAGGAREIVTHDETGQLTPMSDDRALATAIRRYLENPAWSRTVAAQAKRHACEKYSASAMTLQFSELLNGL